MGPPGPPGRGEGDQGLCSCGGVATSLHKLGHGKFTETYEKAFLVRVAKQVVSNELPRGALTLGSGRCSEWGYVRLAASHWGSAGLHFRVGSF